MRELAKSEALGPESTAARLHVHHVRAQRAEGSQYFDLLPVEAGIPLFVDPSDWIGGKRARRIISSIQKDVDQGGTARVRQILSDPEEIYRIEVERPDMAYTRTTFMGRDALTTLLEEIPEEHLRERFIFRSAL